MWALNEYAPLTRVALRHARDAYRDQRFMDSWWQKLAYRDVPDVARAIDEYDAFAATLADAGVQIEYLPVHDDMSPDCVYTRDATVVTPAGLVPCRMGKGARATEPEHNQADFLARGLTGAGTLDDGFLEGGDVVWLDANTIAIGEGYRTTPRGIEALRARLPDSVELVVCPLVHYHGPGEVFHLMSIFSPLDKDLALVYSRLMPVRFRNWLLERGIELIEAPESEFLLMATNVLALAPRRCLMLEGLPETRTLLEAAGCEVLTYSGDEISRKGDGGPTCLTRPLERAMVADK